MTHPRPRPATRPGSLAYFAAKNIKRYRGAESAKDVAARAASEGVEMNRSTLANIETFRREDLTLEEVAALCLALNVSPVDLLCPPDDSPVAVTPEREDPPLFVRSWLRGEGLLPSAAGRSEQVHLELLSDFWGKAPAHERREHDERLRHSAFLHRITALRVFVREALLGPEDEATRRDPSALAEAIRRTALMVSQHADLLADEIEEKGWSQ